MIGIGAGAATAGQVLVFHDLLGHPRATFRSSSSATPRSAKNMVDGVRAYAAEVRAGKFPDPEHTYSVDAEELAEFEHYLEQDSLASVSAWDW